MKEKLTEGPILKRLSILSLPMIWGMFAIIISSAADSFFLGKLGTLPLAAIGMITPVAFIFGSISVGLGVGASSLVSRAIGEDNHDKVRRLTTDSLLLALIIVLAFIIIGILTIEPLFKLMGANDETLPLIKSYMRIWYPGMLFLVVPMVGNGAIRATGNTIAPALIMTITAVSNILLDPILIFGYGPLKPLGVEGAAWASVFSRAITLIWSLSILHFRYRMIDFHFVGLQKTIKSFKIILSIALPSTLTNLVVPLSTTIVTRLVSSYGHEATAGFGIAGRVESLYFIVLYGIGGGTSAFMGQNWGAKKFERVRTALNITTKFSFIYGILAAIFFYFYGLEIARLFSTDATVNSITISYLILVAPSYAFEGVRLINSNLLSAIGHPLYPTLLMFIRMFVIYLPLAIFISSKIGIQGIFLASTFANIIAGIIALYFDYTLIPKLVEKTRSATFPSD